MSDEQKPNFGTGYLLRWSRSARWNVATILLAWFAAHEAAAQTLPWPTNSAAWHAMGANGTNYSDVVGDTSPSDVDIVGDATNTAGFWSYSDNNTSNSLADDALMFRIRVNGDPAGAQRVWQVMFDTDGVISNMEWCVELDDKSSNRVALLRTLVGGSTFGDIELNVDAPAWTGSLTNYSLRTGTPTGDGSNFGGDPDYFVDFGMPWTNFAAATGLTLTNRFRMIISSSTDPNNNNKDQPTSLTDADPVIGFIPPDLTIFPTATVYYAQSTEGSDLVCTIGLSTSSVSTIYLLCYTIDDTAIAGSDYVATSTPIILAPGETQTTFTVQTLSDNLYEGTEQFFVRLIAILNARSTAIPLAVSLLDGNGTPPPPVIVSISRSAADILAWTATNSLRYTLQTSTNYLSGPWTDIGPAHQQGPPAAPWAMSRTNANAVLPAANFYRVIAEP